MARSTATTPQAYLDALPPDRQDELARVRSVVNDNLPGGYREGVGWGAITWEVPLSVYPDTHNGQPMALAALASHKSTATLYLLGAYMIPELRERLETGFRAAGKRLDMGKSCLHFKKADDLALDVIADVIAALPLEEYVSRVEVGKQRYQAGKARAQRGSATSGRRRTSKAKTTRRPAAGSRKRKK